MTRTEVNVILEDQRFTHKRLPKYVGITLDRTLTFKHVTKFDDYTEIRNKVLHKLFFTKMCYWFTLFSSSSFISGAAAFYFETKMCIMMLYNKWKLPDFDGERSNLRLINRYLITSKTKRCNFWNWIWTSDSNLHETLSSIASNGMRVCIYFGETWEIK